ESAMGRDQPDQITRAELVQRPERMEVRRPMPGDGHGAVPLPGVGRPDVVAGALLQVRGARAVDHDHVQVDLGDPDDGVGRVLRRPRDPRGRDRRWRPGSYLGLTTRRRLVARSRTVPTTTSAIKMTIPSEMFAPVKATGGGPSGCVAGGLEGGY